MRGQQMTVQDELEQLRLLGLQLQREILPLVTPLTLHQLIEASRVLGFNE
jgi:hypothetical protein